jgi:5-formyltetrahydrofolate cyclo-ligase
MHVRDEKNQLRSAILERLRRLSPGERDAEGRSLSRRLLAIIPTDSAVCAYHAMSTEAPLAFLIGEVIARGDPVFFPRIEDCHIVFRRFTDPAGLVPGPFGVSEPPPNAERLQRETGPLFVLVPGLAFDAQGRRLGRGNGAYDRWIARQRELNPATRFLGVALECQIVPAVPVEPHDQPLDVIVTAREAIETDGRRVE